MATRKDQIEVLQKRLEQLKAQERKAQARAAAAASAAARKQDTRRKILVGSVILARVESGAMPRERLLSLLDSALTRPADRALFDLPPLAAADSPAAPADHAT